MAHLIRQPLVQFLIGGALFYIALAAFGPNENEGDNSYLVVVDDPALLLYLQYQDKAFDTAQAQLLLSSLDEVGRARLVAEYVRDEIMVREAVSLGLDQNDDVIRQRLIQKMDFIFKGFGGEKGEVTGADVEAFYQANSDRYVQPKQATFTHIFFNGRDRGVDVARRDALATLAELNAGQVSFEQAGRYGDRFFFLRNYIERSDRLIADHFGDGMAEQIFAAEPSATWTGPIQSKYGFHLVMLRRKHPAKTLALEVVADRVLADMERERLDDIRRAAYQQAADNYTIIQQPFAAPEAR